MRKYDFLLFDVDNTLLDFTRAEHDAFMDCLEAFGFARDEQLLRAYSAVNDRHWKILERGEIEREVLMWKRFEVFADECGLGPIDPYAFCDTYVKALSQKSFLLDGALEVCRTLAERYTLCAITNGDARVQHGRFDPSPIYPYFYRTFISDEMGVNKPSQAYFDLVKEALPTLDVKRTLVIGDSLTSDIAGGVAWGTDTCWVCPREDKRGAVAEKGLKPTYVIAHLCELLDIL
ncbi:MAG: YjjG family noncanonical pyrimidine nucleotidase [Clostridia bacterium]|nr:YjjG family noncanonical pyrimidine nucleotidase [Clostridia bacterium]